MKNNQCPKCKSAKRASNLEFRDVEVVSRRKVSATADLPCYVSGEYVYKGSPEADEMRAWMCGNCGFTEFYAPRQAKISALSNRNRF